MFDDVDDESSNDNFMCVFRATHAHTQAAQSTIKLASITSSDVIYDIGCGDARFSRTLVPFVFFKLFLFQSTFNACTENSRV